MKNLQKINKYFLNKLIFMFIIILYSNNLLSSENIIIFKINNKAFTSLDYDIRVQYLDFVGNNENLNQEIILNDFISANIFFEYYLRTNSSEDFNEKVIEIFNNIKKINKENKKEKNYNITEDEILYNLKLDFIRKSIIENLLNSKLEELNKSTNDIDLLYNFNLKYINFESELNEEIINRIERLNKINIESIKSILNESNINYFIKEQEINNIYKIDSRIRDKILSNQRYLFIKKDKQISILLIGKSFETFDSLIANIYSIKSKKNIDKNDLLCDKLKLNKNQNVISKDYSFNKLNNKLKNNLVNINDFIKLNNDNDNDENIYVVLCDIKFDKKKLQNLNINKMISSNVTDIENKFISKYSKVFNLVIMNE